jgi:ATP-binding cassette subfamily C protein CydC
LVIGIPLVQNNKITGAELAMIVLLIIVAFEQLLPLPFAFLSLGKSKAAADRLLEIARTKPAVAFSENITTKQHDIEFKNVSFSYPNNIISTIENFNLSIPSGMHIAIRGDSGSGKTTIANLLARIWDPVRGEITIGGINIKNFSENTLRKTISFVTQYVHIFNATVRDNLTLMQDDFSDDTLFSVLKKVNLDNYLRKLPNGLNTIMGEFGKNFSGGQIRRISIARALLVNAPILILDEPSTGLENALIQDIWKNCEADLKNKTVIVITHDKELLKNLHQTLFLT